MYVRGLPQADALEIKVEHERISECQHDLEPFVLYQDALSLVTRKIQTKRPRNEMYYVTC